MKNTVKRIFGLIVSVIAFVTIFAFCVSAETDLAAMQEDKYKDLMGWATENYGTGVHETVTKYAGMIHDINLGEYSEEEAEALIYLYYEQGMASANVDLIYFSYYQKDARLINDTDNEAVKAMRDGLLSEIAAMTDHTAVNALIFAPYKSEGDSGYCARMYVCVYEIMLDNLLKAGDSTDVRGKISAKKEEIKAEGIALSETLTFDNGEPYTVPTNKSYEELYNKAVASVDVRRNKDSAIKQLNAVFEVIYPGQDPFENETVLAAKEFINLDATETPADINGYLKSAVFSLISVKKDGNKYVNEYIDSLISALNSAVDAANSNEKIAETASVFEDYTLGIEKAKTKDTIAKDISDREYGNDEAMTELEAEYNADGGIIDGCQNADELALEAKRASARAELYGEYLDIVEKINAYGDYPDILLDAKKEYLYYDGVTANDAEGDIAKTADACREEFEALIVSAEVRKYINGNKEILEKEISSVKQSDKSAIINAVNGIDGLSPKAVEVLNENGIADKLAEEYKAVIKQEISDILGNATEDRRFSSNELCDKVGDLTSGSKTENLDKLIADADRLLKKAEETDSIYDRYDAVIANPSYDVFLKEDKDIIDEISDKAAKNISEAADGDDVSAISDKAVLDISRAEAVAEINAKVSEKDKLLEESKNAVAQTVSDAKSEINTETDIEKIAEIADKAVADIEAVFELDEIEKKKLRDAAVAELDEKYSEAKKDIEALEFISAEEKEKLLKDAEDALNEAKEKLADANYPSEIDVEKKNGTDAIVLISESASEKDSDAEESLKSDANTEIDGIYTALVESIDSMKYLDDTQKNELKAEAKAEYDRYTSASDNAKSPPELENEIAEAKKTLSLIGASAENTELAAAKASAKAETAAKKAEAASKLKDHKHLSDEQKNSFAEKLASIVSNGDKNITDSNTVDGVEAERDATVAAIYALEDEAAALEDKEFIAALVPWVIVLSVIAVIEIIAIIALVGANKSAGLSAFAPVAGISVTPVAMQAVTVVLAVADIFMAAVIVYLIIILIKSKKNVEESEPEEEDALAVFSEAESEPELEPEPEPVIIPETVESITVEEADKLISDEDAVKLEHFAEESVAETYTGKRKAEINIDTISRSFEAGERVTLNTLKEKKLVSRDAGAVKVLARGTLDKPLTVVAQSFSVAAVKMIALTGGTVIVAEESPERRKNK